jgi:16S rRNA (guanine527-N7)-methyltransferase
VTPDAFQAFTGVSRETLQDLATYHALIEKWQAKMNLVSPTTLDAIWERHFADSAQIFPLLDPAWHDVADLGSGGGFPGLVLAVLSRGAGHTTRFHLVESDGRKAAFLIEVALTLKLLNHSVHVVAQRAERLGTSPLAGAVDAVTARALAGLPELLAHAAPLLRPGGRCLFLKGARAETEIAAARHAGWQFHLARHASRLDGDGAILQIDALAHTGSGAPALARSIHRP